MLADYLRAAKEVVQAKQARPGVAVHVRLGGGTDGGVGKDGRSDRVDSTDSYAVWAVTAGRDTCGVVRVACSEMAQTEVPRSAVQRVQVRNNCCCAMVQDHKASLYSGKLPPRRGPLWVLLVRVVCFCTRVPSLREDIGYIGVPVFTRGAPGVPTSCSVSRLTAVTSKRSIPTLPMTCMFSAVVLSTRGTPL